MSVMSYFLIVFIILVPLMIFLFVVSCKNKEKKTEDIFIIIMFVLLAILMALFMYECVHDKEIKGNKFVETDIGKRPSLVLNDYR